MSRGRKNGASAAKITAGVGTEQSDAAADRPLTTSQGTLKAVAGGSRHVSKMEAASVLAETYVPRSLQDINRLPVNQVLRTRGISTLEPALLRICQHLVPACPCWCDTVDAPSRPNGIDGSNVSDGNRHRLAGSWRNTKTSTASSVGSSSDGASFGPTQQQQQQPPTTTMPMTHAGQSQMLHPVYRRYYMSPPDMHWAVQSQQADDPGSSASSHRQHEQPGRLEDFPTSDTTGQESAIRSYTARVRRWLQAERRQNLRMFERYSQYNHTVSVNWATYPDRGRNSETTVHADSYMATIAIPGIADAQPPIQSGDYCLLRPMSYISLPQQTASTGILWSDSNNSVEIHSHVLRVIRSSDRKIDQVVITWFTPPFAQIFQSAYPNSQYNIRFVPDVRHHNRCITALGWIESLPEAHVRSLLFPTDAPQLPSQISSATSSTHRVTSNGTSPTNFGNLNRLQRRFVEAVESRARNPSTTVRPPLILTGPAGTGKTKALLASIAKCLELPDTRILVCTPSHTACNVITQRLSEQLQLDRSRMFRLLDCSRSIATIPASILPFCYQDENTGLFAIPEQRQLLQYSVIVCTCVDSYLLYVAGVTNHQLRERRQCFQNWLRKSLEGSNMSIGDGLVGADQPHFTHLFFDEASQATEPETNIPLSVVVDPCDTTRAVEMALIGDPRQLSPQVYSNDAAAAGLATPWMERILKMPLYSGQADSGAVDMLGPAPKTVDDFVSQALRHDSLATFLSMNFRGHPAFLMMISAIFYFDRLHSSKGFGKFHGDVHTSSSSSSSSSSPPPPTTSLRRTIKRIFEMGRLVQGSRVHVNDAPIPMLQCLQYRTWPIHFRGVIGTDSSVSVESFCGGNSWCNQPEAENVRDVVSTLVGEGVSPVHIGVMAPFRGQVVLIRKLLRIAGLNTVNVGTVEDYQAVEFAVIVLSLTRANAKFVPNDVVRRVGVFRQPKRVNVAMTRAEDALVVVGHPELMIEDAVWRQWLFFCLRNGLWAGAGSDVIREHIKRRTFAPVPRSYMDDVERTVGVEAIRSTSYDDYIVVGSMERICMSQDM